MEPTITAPLPTPYLRLVSRLHAPAHTLDAALANYREASEVLLEAVRQRFPRGASLTLVEGGVASDGVPADPLLLTVMGAVCADDVLQRVALVARDEGRETVIEVPLAVVLRHGVEVAS